MIWGLAGVLIVSVILNIWLQRKNVWTKHELAMEKRLFEMIAKDYKILLKKYSEIENLILAQRDTSAAKDNLNEVLKSAVQNLHDPKPPRRRGF